MTRDELLAKLKNKLAYLPESMAQKLAEKLVDCEAVLHTNLVEWAQDKPLSDVWIRDKYCMNAVLEIRGGGRSGLDVADAFLDLNEYVKNSDQEYRIWRIRM